MTTHRLQTSAAPALVIHAVEGDLSLRGWGQNELLARCDGDVNLNQTAEGAELTLEGDASLQVPQESSVRIEAAEGDLVISNVRGVVLLKRVEGDLAINDVGPLTIETVEGDCAVRLVRGDCSVDSVEGDATFSAIAGNLHVEQVSDDLAISGVRGAVAAAAVGDVSLRLVLRAGGNYRVSAEGDLSARVRAEAGANVNLEAGGDLRVRRVPNPEVISGQQVRFVLPAENAPAEGEPAPTPANLHLSAGDDLTLVGLAPEEVGDADFDFNFDFVFDFGPRAAGFVQQFVSQLESQVEALGRQMDEKMTSMGNTEQIATRLQEGILAAARKAEAKISEAMKRMEAHQREAEKRQAGGQPWGAWAAWSPSAGAAAGMGPRPPHRGPVPPVPPAPPVPPVPPAPQARVVSDEERLMVLRMVSEGKISVEQAERLLAALNGQPPTAGAEGDR